LPRKAQTAPPGAFDLTPPPQPRRAISARLGYSNSSRRRQPQPYKGDERPWTAMRSRSDGELEAQEALPKLPDQAKGLILPETKQEPSEELLSSVKQLPGSFSQKTRVREKLEQKQIGTLNTALADYGAKILPGSPGSMLDTPRELYAIPEQLRTSKSKDSPRSSRSSKRRSVKSISPKAHIQSGIGGSNELKRKDDTEDVDAAKKQRLYLPGPITLAQHPAKLRRDSVARLDPFAFDKLESPGRRFSDIVGLDTIVTFFEDFGVVAEVTDATLDQYWLHEGEDIDDIVEEMDARKESVTSVEETPSKVPWVVQSPRGSKFSFSSASSTKPPPEKRKQNRLRGLLSPGLPGSAFLKAPASWGQMANSS
jgi:hypothetical protein